jgi:hypothetical protein
MQIDYEGSFMTTIIFNGIGTALIVFIVVWFFAARNKSVEKIMSKSGNGTDHNH